MVPGAGQHSGDRMVGVVAGMAGWGVSLELLAKVAVMKKSGRGRGSGGGNGGGVSEARRLPQSDRSPVLPFRQLETLAGGGRHCGTEAMQGSRRQWEVSPRSGGPGAGVQDSPKD